MSNLLIQAIGFIGMGLYVGSYQFKNNRRLFIMQVFSYLFYLVHFLLLGALTGSASVFVNLVRSILLSSNWKWARGRCACSVLCIIQIILTAVTWEGCISLLPCIGNLATTIGGYTHNPRKIRVSIMAFNAPLWLIYDIIIGSWAAVSDEIITELSGLISIIRYGWKELDERQE